MATNRFAYTPEKKNRPPCYGCRHCVEEQTSCLVSFYCKAKTKNGREICRTASYIQSPQRDPAIQALYRKIRTSPRPKWCPEEKKGD